MQKENLGQRVPKMGGAKDGLQDNNSIFFRVDHEIPVDIAGTCTIAHNTQFMREGTGKRESGGKGEGEWREGGGYVEGRGRVSGGKREGE